MISQTLITIVSIFNSKYIYPGLKEGSSQNLITRKIEQNLSEIGI